MQILKFLEHARTICSGQWNCSSWNHCWKKGLQPRFCEQFTFRKSAGPLKPTVNFDESIVTCRTQQMCFKWRIFTLGGSRSVLFWCFCLRFRCWVTLANTTQPQPLHPPNVEWPEGHMTHGNVATKKVGATQHLKNVTSGDISKK